MKKYIVPILFPGLLFALAAFAVEKPYEGEVDVLGLLDNIVNWIFAVFLAIAGLFIVLAAFSFLTAGGDSTKLSGARDKLLYAMVGIAVAFLAKAIVPIVKMVLGF